MVGLFDYLPAAPIYALYATFNCISQQTEAASDVISGSFVRSVVTDKPLKFRDPRLNRSREIPSEEPFSTVLS